VFTIKKKIALIGLLLLALLFIWGNYNREVIKSYISEVVTSPSIRVQLINIAKVAIPLKNLILMRNLDDKIALLKSSGSCIFCDLTQGNFKGSDLKGVDLRFAILIGADLSNANLSGANFSGVNLSGANLSNTNLNGTRLNRSNLSGANLEGADLRNKHLTGANLSGVDLSNQDLTGTSLRYVNLTGANLDGVDLRNKDLTGANLSGVDLRNKDLTGANLSGIDLSNQDLTGTIFKDSKKIEISIKNPSISNWTSLNEIPNLDSDCTENYKYCNYVTRYDLSGDVQYLATKRGHLFESKNNESRLVLDLNNEAQFPFNDGNDDNPSIERGFLGIASQNNLVYVAYSSQDINGSYDAQFPLIKQSYSLVVDEYSMNFSKVRNIIKIGGFKKRGFGGSLSFDSFGKLYLSVGDGGPQPDKGAGAPQGNTDTDAQNLNSLKGKILRLDTSDLKLEPEIVAYGIRNPFGVTIDSKDRMFITQCGHLSVEAVYLLNDLYSSIPPNLGWPVFEGSVRTSYDVSKKKDPLMFNDVLAPIFEYNNRPGCATAGVYLDDIELFLFGDFYGTIRLLKEKENGDWYSLHEYKHEEFIWGFGLDKKTKKIFIAPNNFEIEILVDQVKLNQ